MEINIENGEDVKTLKVVYREEEMTVQGETAEGLLEKIKEIAKERGVKTFVLYVPDRQRLIESVNELMEIDEVEILARHRPK